MIFADLLSVTIDEPAQQAIDSALAASVGTRNPIEAASATVATSLALRPDSRPLALWLADAVLARRLNWAVPVPLLAAHLKREELRLAAGPHADAKRWRTACSFAYGRGASVALDLYADLARRADRLLAVAPQLRSKDADATVATLDQRGCPGRTVRQDGEWPLEPAPVRAAGRSRRRARTDWPADVSALWIVTVTTWMRRRSNEPTDLR
ncbi:DUF1403 family protein [Rhizobium nepotum]|uniref:DUF1403 family protein n=1 Tax=Rhizobium nepotum TaxID=1035271 RepID=UPI003CFB6349